MEPIARIELFLAAITGESVELPAPETRAELFLAKIAGQSVELPTPQSRFELFLAKIAGESVTLPIPATRSELYLAAIAGETVEPPEFPQTRLEYFLEQWMAGSGGGELPSGYRRVKGFTFGASTYYLITGFKLRGSDTVRLSFSATKNCNVFGCYTTNDATDNYSLYISTASGAKYLRYDGATYNSQIPSARLGERLDVVIAPTGTTGMPNDSTITPATFTASVDLCVGVTSPSATSSKLDGNIWGNFVVDGRLKLIPCERVSDGVLGYYDTHTKTFYEPTGSAPASLGYEALVGDAIVGTAKI